MPHLIYLTSARDDLAAIWHHIASESGDIIVARTFVEKLLARCEHLASLPGTLGTARPELRPDIRSLSQDGYVIFFRYADDRIEIVNMLNGRRDIERLYSE